MTTATAIEWKLFADLAEHAGTRTVTLEIDPETDTVGDALDALLEDQPDLAERVLDGGELRSQINVLRNGADVRSQEDGLETQLEDGDELALFPPVSGG
ncbi:ubiquitin-like small modifier protein 1 [Natronosalvus hydrolyticus]|uniref:ubiquitin-like small modifier protein 1 n=1 Tax=Natronosalvus hydrolyticus TaxID=2979988 RepID=UPI00319DCCF8